MNQVVLLTGRCYQIWHFCLQIVSFLMLLSKFPPHNSEVWDINYPRYFFAIHCLKLYGYGTKKDMCFMLFIYKLSKYEFIFKDLCASKKNWRSPKKVVVFCFVSPSHVENFCLCLKNTFGKNSNFWRERVFCSQEIPKMIQKLPKFMVCLNYFCQFSDNTIQGTKLHYL